MIYLIEDKASRRKDYGWTDEKIREYEDCLTLISEGNDLAAHKVEMLSDKNNVMLYHESFPNVVKDDHKQVISELKESITKSNIKLAYFSGSKSQRTLNENVCNLPPDALYSNLEVFCNKYRAGDVDFRFLMFGEKPELEENLRKRIDKVNNRNDPHTKVPTREQFFFFLNSDQALEIPFSGNVDADDGFDFDCDDSSLCSTIDEDLANQKYDCIFVPLCFGETLYDFLGLRFAMLIRFLQTKNRLTPIIIYGEAEYAEMINNECFDILKMPGIKYVHSDFASLQNSVSGLRDTLESEYKLGLQNIHLKIPSDIGDNHDVSNKWAIYRWATALGADDDDIEKNNDKVLNNLYFRYLMSLYSVSEGDKLTQENLKIKQDSSQPALNVLYIDDQADEGWYEVLCTFLYDYNQISLDYLGKELKKMHSIQIPKAVTDKIGEQKTNVVILDLRLHRSDANQTDFTKTSGYQVLEKIKKENRGIQVIVFTASNNVSKLQELEDKGVDGYVIKESPADSISPRSTKQSILQLKACLERCSRQTYRAQMWKDLHEDVQELRHLKSKHKINGDYAAAAESLLAMAENAMFAKNLKCFEASTFMSFFEFIELTANQWIMDKPIKDNGDYIFKFRSDDVELKDFDENTYQPNGQLRCKYAHLPYMQKIYNTLYHVGIESDKVVDIVNKRNDFIHPKASKQIALKSFTIEDVKDLYYDIVHKLIGKLALGKN